MHKKIFMFMLLICFYISSVLNTSVVVAQPSCNSTEILHNKVQNTSDYIFTTREINSAKITDVSISITSENFNKEFLEKSNKFTTDFGYEVIYEKESGTLTVWGLIPDFYYNSLYVKAYDENEKEYLMEINNFKTAKSQDPLKQFITQTLQYTLKKYISPMDFYLWEHKILTKEVTPEEFVLRSFQDPKILYSINTNEEFVEKIYSAVFLSSLSQEELSQWMKKFDEYKSKYFLKDEEAYNLIASEMIKSEDFKRRIRGLNIEEREVPLSTRYLEIFKDLKEDYKGSKNNEMLYVMDYDELNRTEMTETTATLFLNEGFKDKIDYRNDLSVDIENATALYKNGKIVIEGLLPNTIYKDFTVTYVVGDKSKKIFIERLKTVKGEEGTFDNVKIVDVGFNILDNFGYTMDEFLEVFYKKKHNIDIKEDHIDYYKILFIVDRVKFDKYLNLVYKSDFDVKDDVLISKLYDIIFNRVPDSRGLNFWVGRYRVYKEQVLDSAEAIKKVIMELSESEEFKSRFNSFIIQDIVKTNNQEKKQRCVASFF